jgi:hypothetical protein
MLNKNDISDMLVYEKLTGIISDSEILIYLRSLFGDDLVHNKRIYLNNEFFYIYNRDTKVFVLSYFYERLINKIIEKDEYFDRFRFNRMLPSPCEKNLAEILQIFMYHHYGIMFDIKNIYILKGNKKTNIFRKIMEHLW